MIRRSTKTTRTDTLFPYTTLFRVDQGGDVGMVEASQDRGLALEALAPGGAERAEGQDFHGSLLARHAVHAFGAVDHGHAAAAELGVQLPVAGQAAGQVAPSTEEHQAEIQTLMRTSSAVF